MQTFQTVVISDLHLGARNTRTDDFFRFLDGIRTDRLVLNGDVFDDPELGRLTSEHLQILERLRQFAKTSEVIWLRGNHDPHPERFSAVLGIDCRDETVIPVGDQKYLVCHGHLWDVSMNLPNWIIDAADAVYFFSQWLDPTHNLARKLKRGCKHFTKAIENLETSAVDEARKRKLAGVILGHTHVNRDKFVDGIHYLNCGCWTEKPSSFVGVIDGVARRWYWESLRRRQAVRQARSRTIVPNTAAPHVALPVALIGE